MTVPQIVPSEPASLVLTGIGLLLIGRIYRGARRRRHTWPRPSPLPVMLVLPACLMLLGSML